MFVCFFYFFCQFFFREHSTVVDLSVSSANTANCQRRSKGVEGGRPFRVAIRRVSKMGVIRGITAFGGGKIAVCPRHQ